MEFKEKYLKYKDKYLYLKKDIDVNNFKGGADLPDNFKNPLIMGAGPIGLITTLALITRYQNRYHINNTTENHMVQKIDDCIEANTIYLVGKENPWRPQIFFFQNSYREYASMDIIRDIHLPTFQKLEQIGSYIGSIPTTSKPYSFSTNKKEMNGSISYKPTLLAENNTTIRAPSEIKTDTMYNPNKYYMMNHLSFQVSDLETVLLDSIIQINNENIKYYVTRYDRKNSELLKFIKDYYDTHKSKFDILETLHHDIKNLIIALLMKDLLIKNFFFNKNLINLRYNHFKPLVIILHPYNKYSNIDVYMLYKNFEKDDICFNSIIEMTKITEYISEKEEIKGGFGFTSSWIPERNKQTNDIELIKKIETTEVNDKKMKVNYEYAKHLLVKEEDYNIIYECSAGGKQFGKKDDYYYIRNKNEKSIDECVKLDNTLFMILNLNQNTLIKLEKDDKSKKIYVIIKKEIKYENEGTKKASDANIIITFDLLELVLKDEINDKMDTNLYNYKLKVPEIVEKFIIKITNDSIDKSTDIERIKNIAEEDWVQYFTINLYRHDETPESTKVYYKKFLEYLNKTKINNINITKTNGSIEIFSSIYKINSLVMEEVNIKNIFENPDRNEPATNSLVFASVWMYKANRENNTMYEQKYAQYNPSPNCDVPFPTNVPISASIIYNQGNCPNQFNKTKKIREDVDKSSILSQVYINNAQVETSNDNITRNLQGQELIDFQNKNLHQQNNVGNFTPQHIFRVFGVNLNKNSNIIQTPILKKFIKRLSDEDKSEYNCNDNNNTHYYCGIQISTELNNFVRKSSSLIQKIIYQNLYLLGLLYTIDHLDVDELLLTKEYNDNEKDLKTNTEICTSIFDYLQNVWKDTYGKKAPTTLNDNICTPVHEKLPGIFPITLKYKLKSIEEDSNKLVFNMGDTNTTVNFFSGTGLNTGVANVRKILTEFKLNNQQNIDEMNDKLMKKNRRTIYNSLLSSQNASYLSPKRLFTYNKEEYGPYLKNISNEDEKVMNDIITNELKFTLFNDDFDSRYLKQVNNKIKIIDINKVPLIIKKQRRFQFLIENYDCFFGKFIEKEDKSMMIKETELPKIKQALIWNAFVYYHNTFIYNPLINQNITSDPNEYKRESITYLNHLRFHYFDFCNFMKNKKITGESETNNNKDYFCDILKDIQIKNKDPNPIEYDSRRSNEFLDEWFGENL
jgi:hypothetical protein